MTSRQQLWQQLENQTFDAVIVGGGISGAALFRQLSLQNYRCLLVDQGDFASGTSQASGMLIWGGLLYLKNMDLRTVVQLSSARDKLIRELPDVVQPATFRYLSRLSGTRPGWLVRAALEAYWWLGGCRRKRPKRERYFNARGLLAEQRFGDSITYEEGVLPYSDARLVLRWIEEGCNSPSGSTALGYCRLDSAEAGWQLKLRDTQPRFDSPSPSQALPNEPPDAPSPAADDGCLTVNSRCLINAAGVWADQLNTSIGLQSSHRHVFSKGVYLGLPRPPQLQEFLAFEMGAHGDTLTYTPWGPIALWGPTETPIDTLDGAFTPNADDLRFLLDSARDNLRHQFMPQDIISLRCGVRPLAVAKSYQGNDYPLDLSRRCVVDVDHANKGMTLYGGKLTSAPKMAAQGVDQVRDLIGEGQPGERPPFADDVGLYDYLRRRTNIAQWTPRLGLGRHGEYRDFLHQLAVGLHGEDQANAAVADLESRARAQDELLQQIY